MEQYSALIGRVAAFVESRIEAPLDLDLVSSRFRLPNVHLHRVFRALTGMPLMECVRRRRILDIALEAGFSHEQSYTRAFRNDSTGTRLSSFDGLPQGMKLRRISTRKYAAFTLLARHHPRFITWDEISALHAHIFRQWIPSSPYVQADAWHLESVHAGTAREDDGEFQILVSLAPRPEEGSGDSTPEAADQDRAGPGFSKLRLEGIGKNRPGGREPHTFQDGGDLTASPECCKSGAVARTSSLPPPSELP